MKVYKYTFNIKFDFSGDDYYGFVTELRSEELIEVNETLTLQPQSKRWYCYNHKKDVVDMATINAVENIGLTIFFKTFHKFNEKEMCKLKKYVVKYMKAICFK